MPCNTISNLRGEPNTVGIHEPLISGDFGGADGYKPFRILFAAIKPRRGVAFDISDLRPRVEHQSLRWRQRPYGTQQFAGFRRAGQPFGHGGAGFNAFYAVFGEIQRPVDAFIALPPAGLILTVFVFVGFDDTTQLAVFTHLICLSVFLGHVTDCTLRRIRASRTSPTAWPHRTSRTTCASTSTDASNSSGVV